MTEEHPQGFRECKDELTMRKTEEYFLIDVFGKEKCSLLAAGGAKIKPLAGKRPKIIMPAVRIAAADTGYPLPQVRKCSPTAWIRSRRNFPNVSAYSPSYRLQKSVKCCSKTWWRVFLPRGMYPVFCFSHTEVFCIPT